jgi:hypothetical protein
MRQAVCEIYSSIISFLLRADHWHKQSKCLHVWEALSRPVELCYNDLLQDVDDCTRKIETLANAAAQAEQRDMHLEIQTLSETVKNSEVILREVQGLLICGYGLSRKKQ